MPRAAMAKPAPVTLRNILTKSWYTQPKYLHPIQLLSAQRLPELAMYQVGTGCPGVSASRGHEYG